MNLFELFVKIGVDDQASGKLSDLSSKLGNGLKTAAKIGTAAVGAAAAGITALTTAAVNNYAEYEQLVGGIETLFEDLSWDVGQNAAKAFQTAGLSANEYMSTAMSFAASLNQSLTRIDGNIARSAEMTDQAIIDMADNANKMGTDIGMIQNAYQGFAKQNYTMLDNLKLGYGGTAQEMYRLLERAAELDETFAKTANFSIDSKGHLEAEFADITQAIHIVQTEMGITGTTAKEAGQTISGSVSSMKSAWTNLVTGFADGNADIESLIEDLVETIVGDGTENNLGVIGNVLPAIETALDGIASLIEGAAPKIIEILPGLVERVVPSVISAATGMVNAVIAVLPDLLNTVVDALIQNAPVLITAAIGLVQSLIQGIQDNYQILVDGATQIVTQLTTGILNMLPQIIALGLDLIVSLANGIAENVDELLPAVLEAVTSIGNALIENAPELINAGIELASAIMNGILEQFAGLEPIIMAVVAAFGAYRAITLASEVASKAMAAGQWLVNAAMNANPIMLIVTLIAGLVAAVITLWNTNEGFRTAVITAWEAIKSAASTIFTAIAEFFTVTIPEAFNSFVTFISNGVSSFLSIGSEIVENIKQGINDAWNGLVEWFNGIWDSLFGGRNVDVGVSGSGTATVDGSHAGGLAYVPYDGYIAELHEGERVLTSKEAKAYRSKNTGSVVNITVNMTGNADENTGKRIGQQIVKEMRYRGMVTVG